MEQLKGILKKPPPPKTAAQDAREVAIQHARFLQHRKDLEAEILDSVILLSEFPLVRDAPYNAANPAPSDTASFKMHIRLFQPSDYDDLIVERNVNELCGYTLCGKPKKHAAAGGKWKLTTAGDIIKREDYEKWCSQKCARRAMYVKVQLNETAAWERAGIPDIHIDLLEEEETQTEADIAAKRLADLRLEDQRKEAADAAALATERGQKSVLYAHKKLEIRLKEKTPTAPSPDAMSIDEAKGSGDHMVVEGYTPKLDDMKAKKESSSSS